MRNNHPFVVCLVLAACSHSSGSSPVTPAPKVSGIKSPNATVESHKGSYTFEYQDTNCDTGEHSYSDLEAYCHGLVDETIKKGCASDRGRAEVNSSCQTFIANGSLVLPTNTSAPSDNGANPSTNNNQPIPSAEPSSAGSGNIPKLALTASSDGGITFTTAQGSDGKTVSLVAAALKDLGITNGVSWSDCFHLDDATSIEVVKPSLNGCTLDRSDFSGFVQKDGRSGVTITAMGQAGSVSCILWANQAKIDGFALHLTGVDNCTHTSTIGDISLSVAP